MTGGLAVAQRWVQDVLTDPDGVDAGIARAGASARPLHPDAVVNGSAALSSRDRLALYSRAYRMRLMGCLRESHPGLRHALGDELFDDFALDYLRARPSHSYTLATLGADWPAHLEATRPDADRPAAERESWPDFLVDLARLERTFLDVYDAPGNEGHEPPSLEPLDRLIPAVPHDRHDRPGPHDRLRPGPPDGLDRPGPPDGLDRPGPPDRLDRPGPPDRLDRPGPPDRLDRAGDPSATLTVTPAACLRLLELRFPADAYLVAVRRGEDPPLPAPAPTYVALGRRDYVVTIVALAPTAHRLLGELAAGAVLADAARAAGLTMPAALPLIADWARRGLIAAIDVPGPTIRGDE